MSTKKPTQSSDNVCGADSSGDERVPWDTCQHPAGWGTEHQGGGLCMLHEDDEEYLPEYGLFEPNHGYFSRQDEGDREKLEKIAYDVTERFRQVQGTVDEVDKEIARQIAVDMHLVRRTSKYVAKPLAKKNEKGDQKVNKLIHQHRRLQESVIDRMTKLGVLQDPETKMAQAEEDKADSWRELMEDGFE